MKKLLAKIKAFIRKLLGKTAADIIIPISVVKKWDECTKSSNWWGSNAAHRAMNALSPKFTEGKFKEYIKFQKDRGCNYVNLFVTNKGDGEGAGYSIWGTTPFAKPVKNDTTKLMLKRMEYCRDQGLGVWIWLLADDSTAWNKTILSKVDQFAKDLKDGGYLDDGLVTGVVLGLEMEEYCSVAQAKALRDAVKKYWKGKIATHHVSNGLGLAVADIAFIQMNPGRSDGEITNFVKKAKNSLKKPICMFELERSPDRHRSEVALKAGAYSVGNW